MTPNGMKHDAESSNGAILELKEISMKCNENNGSHSQETKLKTVK